MNIVEIILIIFLYLFFGVCTYQMFKIKGYVNYDKYGREFSNDIIAIVLVWPIILGMSLIATIVILSSKLFKRKK